MVISGICAYFSFYMASLAFRSEDSGIFLFAVPGLFFMVPFLISVIKIISSRSENFNEVENKISGEPRAVHFLPHWFMMSALIFSGIAILAAIIIPVITR